MQYRYRLPPVSFYRGTGYMCVRERPSITMPTLSKTVALLLLVQPATSSLLPTTDLLAQANVAVSSTDAIACACQRHEPTTTLVTNAFLITFLLLVNRGR